MNIICLLVLLALPAAMSADVTDLVPPDALFVLCVDSPARLEALLERTLFTTSTLPLKEQVLTPWLDRKANLSKWDLPLSWPLVVKARPRAVMLASFELNPDTSSDLPLDLNLVLERPDNPRPVLEVLQKFRASQSERGRLSGETWRGVPISSITVYYTTPKKIPVISPRERKGKKGRGPGLTAIEGMTLMGESSLSLHYALTPERLFITIGPVEHMRTMIDRSLDAPLEVVSRKGEWLDLFAYQSPSPCLRAFVNLVSLADKALPKDSAGLRRVMEQSNFRALGFTVTESADSFRVRIALLAPEPRRALSRALFQFRPCSFDTMRLVPPDALSCSIFNVEIWETWLSAITSAETAWPDVVTPLRRTLQANEGLLGVSLERDILAGLRGEIGYFVRPSKGRHPFSLTFFAQVRDPEQFQVSIRKLLTFLGATFLVSMREQTINDVPCWIPIPPGPGLDADYVPRFAVFQAGDCFVWTSDPAQIADILSRAEAAASSDHRDVPLPPEMTLPLSREAPVGLSWFSRGGMGLMENNIRRSLFGLAPTSASAPWTPEVNPEALTRPSLIPFCAGPRVSALYQNEKLLFMETFVSLSPTP